MTFGDYGPHADEDVEELLLPPDEKVVARKPTPLPRLQISVLLFFQLAEPITSQCIYPFINQVLTVVEGESISLIHYAACQGARYHRRGRDESGILCGSNSTCPAVDCPCY